MANIISKTPIIYYGGKTSILPNLLEMVPGHQVYTESFFGGGALFWSKTPVKNETINDRLDIVVNFYKTLRTHYKPLKRLIDSTLISRAIHDETLFIIRDFKKTYNGRIHNLNVTQKVNLAWAFWVRSNFSHMNKLTGGYKQEKDGGRSIAQNLKKRKSEFTELLVTRIENTTIENADYKKVIMARNSKEAFHYIDPPYPDTHQDPYTYFGDSKYTWTDFEELLILCTNLKGKFLLSSYGGKVLDEYVQKFGWFKKEITHQLKHSRKNGSTEKTEVLVSNYGTTCGTLKLF